MPRLPRRFSPTSLHRRPWRRAGLFPFVSLRIKSPPVLMLLRPVTFRPPLPDRNARVGPFTERRHLHIHTASTAGCGATAASVSKLLAWRSTVAVLAPLSLHAASSAAIAPAPHALKCDRASGTIRSTSNRSTNESNRRSFAFAPRQRLEPDARRCKTDTRRARSASGRCWPGNRLQRLDSISRRAVCRPIFRRSPRSRGTSIGNNFASGHARPDQRHFPLSTACSRTCIRSSVANSALPPLQRLTQLPAPHASVRPAAPHSRCDPSAATRTSTGV